MNVIIDVSEHNGIIQWDLVKPQIDGAIVRCGYGGNTPAQDDAQYERNIKECTRLGIPVGVYLFSYARNVEEAKDEAAHVLRLVQGWNLQLPIYYDIEYSAYAGDISADVYTQMVKAFAQPLEDAGGFVGVYANTSYWETKLYQVTQYTRWVAQWADAVTLDQPYKLWQYTSDGVIEGSSPRTDLSRYYDDFLTMAAGKNQFGDAGGSEPSEPSLTYGVGDHVRFHALYTSSTSTNKITNIAVHEGVITKVIAGVHNPYLINNGTGWVNDDVIDHGEESLPNDVYQVGDYVTFNALYTSSTSTNKITNIAVHSGMITQVLDGAANPYLINNGTGWVNARVITSGGGSTASFTIGETVRVKQGAKDYRGTSLAPFVYDTLYQVMDVSGDRIVIGIHGKVTAAMHVDDLYHA